MNKDDYKQQLSDKFAGYLFGLIVGAVGGFLFGFLLNAPH